MKYTDFNTAVNSNQSSNTTQMRIIETSVVYICCILSCFKSTNSILKSASTNHQAKIAHSFPLQFKHQYL